MKPALIRPILLVAGSLWLLPAPLFADAYYWIRKTGPGGVKPGDQVTYTIELNNAGGNRMLAHTRENVGQLMAAVGQSSFTASEDQQQRILDIVNNARREVYQVLSEE